MSLVSAWVSD
uniref:Uncharacterized protein n=1 Tax=Rhizophora mucronata TaxID=61149 RepID=A0A2P2NUT6_RHIMU